MAVDVAVVGAGVVGLSLAYELAGKGRSVCVVDRGPAGRESSWAGAGIVPPAYPQPLGLPLAELGELSSKLHAAWAAALREETGVDNGYRTCGGMYAEYHDLVETGWEEVLVERGIPFARLTPREILDLEPNLSPEGLKGAVYLPGECQVRNPRHVKALQAACLKRGVRILEGIDVLGVEVSGGTATGLKVRGSTNVPAFGQLVLAPGAWASELFEPLGLRPVFHPIRGQIVLLQGSAPLLKRVFTVGKQYFVQREDGRLLVGSTEENVGFVKENTAEAVGELLRFAVATLPATAGLRIERTWAGLRPSCGYGVPPCIGPLPGWGNIFAAAGHFRTGLHLSAGTGRVLTQLLCGETPEVSLAPFAPGRFSARK